MKHILDNIDTILIFIIAISLVELHLVLSIIAMVITIVYNTVKLVNYIKEKQNENEIL